MINERHQAMRWVSLTPMNEHIKPESGVAADAESAGVDYDPPRLTTLGTLADLTAGGTQMPDDGMGGSGDIGSGF
jgi:hypothetical protein